MFTTTGFAAIPRELIVKLGLPDKLNLLLFGFTRQDTQFSPTSSSAASNRRPSRRKLTNSEIEKRLLQWVRSRPSRYADFTMEDLIVRTQLDSSQIKTYLRSKKTTFRDWKLNLRINEAKRLLIEDRFNTIEEIGKRLGFNSKANFFRRFRKVVGVTPKTWKDNYL